MIKFIVKIAMLIPLLVAFGCNSDKGPSLSAPASSPLNPVPQPVASPNCLPQQTVATSPTPTSSSTFLSFMLANEITYEQNIKPVVVAKCLSCHSSQGNPLKNPDLTLSANAIADSYSLRRVAVGELKISEHADVSLSADEKNLFNQWRDNSYNPGTSSGTSIVTSTNVTSTIATPIANTTNCGTVTPLPSGTLDDLSDLINSERKKKCVGLGKMVNRDKNVSGDAECFNATIDATWCNPQGVKDKFNTFNNSGAAAEAKINELKGQGFEFDQCGVENGSSPLVTFFKREVAQESLQLSVLRPM